MKPNKELNEAIEAATTDAAFRAWIRSNIPLVAADLLAQRLDPRQSVGLLVQDCLLADGLGGASGAPLAATIPRSRAGDFIALSGTLGDPGKQMAKVPQEPPEGMLPIFWSLCLPVLRPVGGSSDRAIMGKNSACNLHVDSLSTQRGNGKFFCLQRKRLATNHAG